MSKQKFKINILGIKVSTNNRFGMICLTLIVGLALFFV